MDIVIKPKRRRTKKSIFCFTCPCGTEFIANHNQAKYCSDECRKQARKNSWNKYSKNNPIKKKICYMNNYDKNSGKIIKRTKEYQNTERGKLASKISQIKSSQKHPEKFKARSAVHTLISNGILEKEPCEICGEIKNIHAHHDDYSKPGTVRWLCVKCHNDYHKKFRRKNKGYVS